MLKKAHPSAADLRDVNQALQFLVDTVRASVPALRARYAAYKTVQYEARKSKKEKEGGPEISPYTMVTEVDDKINGLFIARMRKVYGDRVGLLAEEKSVNKHLPFAIDLDPADGTDELAACLPGPTIMAAYRHKEEVLASIVFDPLPAELGGGLYTAGRVEDGAFRDGERVYVNDQTAANGAQLFIDPKLREEMPGMVYLLQQAGYFVRDTPPTGKKLTAIAEGRIAGTIRSTGVDDVRIGLHLVRAAGGRVVSLDGDHRIFVRDPETGDLPMRDGYIAANPTVAEHLLKLVTLYRTNPAIKHRADELAARLVTLRKVIETEVKSQTN